MFGWQDVAKKKSALRIFKSYNFNVGRPKILRSNKFLGYDHDLNLKSDFVVWCNIVVLQRMSK